MVLDITIAILISGSLFALVAAGFSLVYRVTKIVHLAHGVLVVASAYVFWTMIVRGYGVPLAVFSAISVAVVSGMLMHYAVYERLRIRGRARTTMSLIATLALLMLGENILLAIFGSETRYVFTDAPFRAIAIGDTLITVPQLLVILISLGAIFITMMVVSWTSLGARMRAVADNSTVASIVGINAARTRLIAMVIASVLAGIAGVLMIVEFNVSSGHATTIAIRAFSRAIVGGIGSLGGAIVGSFALETAENIGAYYFSAAYKNLFSFVILFFFLFFRPRGLFGGYARGEENE
jgi:branched-chain amino acid transport system permease protein